MKHFIKNKIEAFIKYRSSKKYYTALKQESDKIELTPLTSSQKKQILDYYKEKTGLTVNTDWHEYFYSRNNIFSVQYIPVDFYNNELIYRLNQFNMRHAYSDKNIYDLLFSEFNKPKTVLQSINDFYYHDGKSVSYQEALEICYNVENVIIKPSLEGTWGEGVEFISISKGVTTLNNLTTEELFKLYKGNFIIQDYIKQHADLSALNQSSVNTIRIITYRSEDGVKPIYHVLRIGQKGSKVDNVGFGGINVKILENGSLNNIGYGYDATKTFTKSSSGITLENYKVPNFKKLINTAKEMHLKLPYFRIVGWDFAVDESGNAVFIEWNRAPDLGQYYGPPFGKYTDEILRTFKSLVNTREFNI